jgi:CRISPR system Cascade subunit CasA
LNQEGRLIYLAREVNGVLLPFLDSEEFAWEHSAERVDVRKIDRLGVEWEVRFGAAAEALRKRHRLLEGDAFAMPMVHDGDGWMGMGIKRYPPESYPRKAVGIGNRIGTLRDQQMNLLQNDWITIQRRSGRTERIAPMRLTANADDPAVEIRTPRADFRGALYQFLIGLLQTAFAPRDFRQWQERWNAPPNEAALSEAFATCVKAFELDTDGPAFMQDFNLPNSEYLGIAALLIDAPGDKTKADNKDHFVHREGVQQICYGCAATALFTLQINSPSGGAGHRVSVRGGGPLTTLLVPENNQIGLWQKIWMNILPQDALSYPANPHLSEVLPWLAPTRTSEPGGVGDTTPESVHPLQAYWSMPRRIRLDFSEEKAGACDLCGQPTERLTRRYRTKNYGVNYTGTWLHPLSPYNYDPKGEKPPLPVKGQRGGIGYRHWLGLTLGNEEKMPDAATAVKYFNWRLDQLPENAQKMRLWCFGYDLDNMKARCWYDGTVPVYVFTEYKQRRAFVYVIARLLEAAEVTAYLLHNFVKAAWFKRPSDAGSEPAVPLSFWQSSETEFYRLLEKISRSNPSVVEDMIPFYKDWLISLRNLAIELFDKWVLVAPIEEMNMARVVKARTDLLRLLRKTKATKDLWRVVEEYEEEKHETELLE